MIELKGNQKRLLKDGRLELTRTILNGECGERRYGGEARVDTAHHSPDLAHRLERQHLEDSIYMDSDY